MQGLIIYVDKFTQQYAEWLSQDSDLLLKLPGRLPKYHLQRAGYLLIVIPPHFKKNQLKTWLTRHEERIKDKDVFLYVLHATDEETQNRYKYKQEYIPEAIRQNCEIYFMSNHLVLRNSLSE